MITMSDDDYLILYNADDDYLIASYFCRSRLRDKDKGGLQRNVHAVT